MNAMPSAMGSSTLRHWVASLQAYRDGEMPASSRSYVLAFAIARFPCNVQSEAQHDRGKLQRDLELRSVAFSAIACEGLLELDSLCFATVRVWLRLISRDGIWMEPFGC